MNKKDALSAAAQMLKRMVIMMAVRLTSARIVAAALLVAAVLITNHCGKNILQDLPLLICRFFTAAQNVPYVVG